MTACPACRAPLAFHTDADCLQAQAQRAEVARVILRDTMAVPFREEITADGKTAWVAISMTGAQYEVLKRFAGG